MSEEKEGLNSLAPNKYDRLVARENQARSLWAQEGVKEKQLTPRADRPNFVFYEGPPTANGRPGVHHLFNRTLKDTLLRWQWFLGYNVKRQAAWDTHGLPVELEVEKALGLQGKVMPEQMEEFVGKCQESVGYYQGCWEEASERLGYWLDWERATRSDNRAYVQSVWWVLRRLWDQGLLEEQYRVGPWCPKCQTNLATHEVAQGTMEVNVSGLVVRADLMEPDGEVLGVGGVAVEAWFWTTTPWTMGANAALAVKRGGEYVVLMDKANNKGVLVAKNLVAGLGLEDWTVLGEFMGSELGRYKYKSFYSDVFRRVVATDWVSTENGTGVVHLAPMYSGNDYQTGREEKLEMLELLDEQGKMRDGEFEGMDTKMASKMVVVELKTRGLVVKETQDMMERGYCWRCQSLLVDRARMGWFVKVAENAWRMMEYNRQVEWRPERVGSGRFGGWLLNTRDWSVGRTRTWGTPLPLWRCEKCSVVECVGSVSELVAKGVEVADGDLAVHRPAVDSYQWLCGRYGCSGNMRRVMEVVDTWFDSGCLPFAEAGFPKEGAEERFNENWPADLVVEGVDQTRGWFYSLLAVGSCLGEGAPYHKVVVHDLVLDKLGKKMSKSLGNGVDAEKLLNEVSTDQLRVSLLSGTDVSVSRLFNQELVAKGEASALQTLVEMVEGVWLPWFKAVKAVEEDAGNLKEDVMDRWLRARLARTGEEVTAAMGESNTTRMVERLAKFTVEYLSQWYLRLNRRKLLERPGSDEAKASGMALTEVLRGVVALWASVAPHLAESLGRDLGMGSVHLLEGDKDFAWWQVVSGCGATNRELENWMDVVREVVSLGRVARQKAKVAVKQPLMKLRLSVETWTELGEEGRGLVASEVAVKEVSFGDGPKVEVRPVWSVLGELFKGNAKAVALELTGLDEEQKKELVSAEGWVTKMGTVPREGWTLSYKSADNWVVAGEKMWVMLDTRLTEELVFEGRVRELSRAVQQARKEAGVLREAWVEVLVEAPEDWQDVLAEGGLVERCKVRGWRWVEGACGLMVSVVREEDSVAVKEE